MMTKNYAPQIMYGVLDDAGSNFLSDLGISDDDSQSIIDVANAAAPTVAQLAASIANVPNTSQGKAAAKPAVTLPSKITPVMAIAIVAVLGIGIYIAVK